LKYTVPYIPFKKVIRKLKTFFEIDANELSVVEFVSFIYQKAPLQTDAQSQWFYVYKRQLEQLTINYIEYLTVLAQLGVIDILQEDVTYKLRIRFNERYTKHYQKITKSSLYEKISSKGERGKPRGKIRKS
jgi:oligoribonuclease NrnB/cAMP/cGMP phosphodiesterase (DHH superfamily)